MSSAINRSHSTPAAHSSSRWPHRCPSSWPAPGRPPARDADVAGSSPRSTRPVLTAGEHGEETDLGRACMTVRSRCGSTKPRCVPSMLPSMKPKSSSSMLSSTTRTCGGRSCATQRITSKTRASCTRSWRIRRTVRRFGSGQWCSPSSAAASLQRGSQVRRSRGLGAEGNSTRGQETGPP